MLDNILMLFGWAEEDLPLWLQNTKINNIALAATSVWRYTGQNMIMFLGAMMSVDDSLYEAASLDGANKWHQFRYIMLPSIKTIIVLNLILSISGSLCAFEPPYVITNGTMGTGTYFVIMNRIAHENQKVGLACAMAILDPNFVNMQMGNPFHFDCVNLREKRFVFQLCGKRSLEVVEHVCRKDLHDLKFMYITDAQIDGKKVSVLRTGMAGTLAYEIHGDAENAPDIYQKILEVGAAYGLQEIGRLCYVNQHCEGSIFQLAEHFNIDFEIPGDKFILSGSLPRDSELQFHSPFDCGWGNLVKFNHDFPGKEALLAESQRHHNTAVHLIWNKEDILKVQAAVMDPDKRTDYMDMVGDYDYKNNCSTIHMDAIYDGDKIIGASSDRMLSAKTREMISICTIDEDYAVEGKEVEVLWGNPGTYQIRIRATVTLMPYIKEDRNNNFDVERIPHPTFL